VGCAALSSRWLEGRFERKHAARRQVPSRCPDHHRHSQRSRLFDPLSTAKVTCLIWPASGRAKHRKPANGRGACGFVPSPPAWQREARSTPVAAVADRWRRRGIPRLGSEAWRYLTEVRGIPDTSVIAAVGQGTLREGPRGSMWAAHGNDDGALLGWEERGPEWRGFATGGAKELFRLGPSAAPRICITEAAIDAMSLAAIQVLRPDTLYVSTGGGWSPASEEAIRRLASRRNTRLVGATDTIGRARFFAERIRRSLKRDGASNARARPRAAIGTKIAVLLGRLARSPSRRPGDHPRLRTAGGKSAGYCLRG